MDYFFSFIIPVYNRPREVQELFESLQAMEGDTPFEVVLVEDGSTEDASAVVAAFRNSLPISYLVKENTGPGPSRNYGMQRARGNYFIILDSDIILPPEYLRRVVDSLNERYVDCFGGPDKAHPSFTPVQKSIDYVMTSFLTTGGIRGGKAASKRFEPRSFNMGLSARAFHDSGGFGNIHPGEDPDLSIRLKKMGYSLALFPTAFVYHKRRISFKAFFRQVRKFGKVRPILNRWHPGTSRLTYWFPTLFVLGLLLAVLLLFVLPAPLRFVLPALYAGYLTTLLANAFFKTGSPKVALLAVAATILQFSAYGLGFLESTILVTFSKRKPEEIFPELFF